MASKTDTSTAGRSDPSTVSAAALRLDPLLRKIRDGLSQYLEAFALAIQGARRQDIKWPLFTLEVPDPGDGGTIDVVQQEAGDFVGFDNFGVCRFNIPISGADIETAASYLRDCGLDPDAQRLLEVFKGLKAAFCSVVEFIPLSDGSMANRKFYAQDRALMLLEHLGELIRTLPTILTTCLAGPKDQGNDDPADTGGKGDDPNIPDPDETLVRKLRGYQRPILLYLWKRGNVTRDQLRKAVWKEKKTSDKGMDKAVERLNIRLYELNHTLTSIESNGGMYYLKHPQK